MNSFFLGLSKALAIVGGFVLSVLIILIVASIIGRETGLGAVTGDYEIVEAGMAFCIFAFLPYAQMTGAHATVDIFTNSLGNKTQAWLIAIIEVVFAIVLVIIAVQLLGGFQSKLRSGQTTLLLQFPVWWGYAAAFAAAVVGGVVGVWHALVKVTEAATGKTIAVEGGEV
ncbi:TRAP transporter small permease [Maritimibacter sp. UBA3975]|uniref:TRAP transporter small permease n=1 Tax=Maritimibacter sp. UBA3975 TaxID=1946833 RepID=UPI000C0AE129|nr:TRAP transporter small permease [Maritimibacter sp. UBA3975]MAM63138.1 C4-dicarboxylate ABC transporter permease [Maritimibacter sp.]